VAGTSFAWTNDNPSIGLAGTGNGNIASFNATNTGSTVQTATVTVTPSANGCTGTPETFTISVNPTFIGVENGVICNGDVYTFGGQPYTTPGNYPVTFQTVNGCDSLVTLNLIVNPIYNIVLNETICRGSVYTFNGVNYSQSGIYTISFNSVNGCDSVYVINLNVQGPIASFSAIPSEGCLPLVVTFNNTSGPGVVSSSWNFGNSQTGNVMDPTIIYKIPGTYDISLVVTDALGCKDSLTSIGLVIVHPRPVAGMTVRPTEVYMDEPYIYVTDESSNATSWSYLISDGFATGQSDFSYSFDEPGTYTVMQVVYTTAGCADTTYEEVVVKPVTTFFIPNAFTPNGGIENEFFTAYGNMVSDFKMSIFDRWGELMFKTESIEMGWDGTYGGKPCKQDVYVYKITYRDHFGREKSVLGSVTLFR
jgi:gliding motility-associated-like protein